MPRPVEQRCLRTLDYIRTARITVEGSSFEKYWTSRGRNLRKNMRRQLNVLKRAEIEPRLEVLSRPEEMAQAIADYGRLESAGWKAETGTAIHPDNDQGRF